MLKVAEPGRVDINLLNQLGMVTKIKTKRDGNKLKVISWKKRSCGVP